MSTACLLCNTTAVQEYQQAKANTLKAERSPSKYVPSPSVWSQWLLPFHLQPSVSAWVVAPGAKNYSFLNCVSRIKLSL